MCFYGSIKWWRGYNMRKYFVSYATELGFGNAIVECQNSIINYDDLLSTEQQLQSQLHTERLPIILFYKEVYDV